jgi:hypothetical protein
LDADRAPQLKASVVSHLMTPATRILILFFLLSVLVVLSNCSAHEFAPQYSISKLDLPNGKAIYFKREVRGLLGNYDVVAISPNGDPCASVNSDNDYCICSDREYVYYKLDGDTLHLYYATANSAPKKNNFPLKVVNHDINIMRVDEFKRTYAKDGITRLELPVDDTKKCG